MRSGDDKLHKTLAVICVGAMEPKLEVLHSYNVHNQLQVHLTQETCLLRDCSGF